MQKNDPFMEALALMLLRGGSSCEEAARQSRLLAEEVNALWDREKSKSPRHA